MNNFQRLGDLQETIDGLTELDILPGLQKLVDLYGVKHCVYLGLSLPTVEVNQPQITHTHDQIWVDRYEEMGYQNIDPVLIEGSRSLLPLDWKQLNSRDSSTRDFFTDASDHGVGSQGLTIPVRGYQGELALFSISTEEPDSSWLKFKDETLPELNMLAFYIHDRNMKNLGLIQQPVTLSPRQIDVLQWAANGKTTSDISVILEISEHTVRAYNESARYKLNALNTTHAVARAIAQNLISKPD